MAKYEDSAFEVMKVEGTKYGVKWFKGSKVRDFAIVADVEPKIKLVEFTYDITGMDSIATHRCLRKAQLNNEVLTPTKGIDFARSLYNKLGLRVGQA